MATSDKYDRQLRLWGASGQKALAETCIVLLRATASGTETLKNLVLPGVGAYCVVDERNATVTPQDVSSNFFTASDPALDISRAQVACQQLQELNPDVQGSFVLVENWQNCFDSTEAWQRLIVSQIKDTTNKRLLIVASDLEVDLKLALAQLCHTQQLPLILVQNYGLLGSVRLQTPPLAIMNPKPRDSPPDLRLTDPFPALKEMALTLDWTNMDSKQHKHVPYPLILLRVQHEYRSAHKGQLPGSFDEKQIFSQAIKDAAQNYGEEDNFQEAVRNAYLAYAARSVDVDHIRSLLEQAQQASNMPRFVVLLQALLEFLELHNGQSPLQGNIPDMTASTDLYVELQSIYREQAQRDLQEFQKLVAAQSASHPNLAISEEDITTFCQNVHHLDVLSPRTLQEEIKGGSIPDEVTDDLVMALAEEDERLDMVPLLWYLGLQACDLFYLEYHRYPGTPMEHEFMQDVPILQSLLKSVLERYGLLAAHDAAKKFVIDTNAVHELCRYGNAELHNVAAIVGGVASQEAVKLITGQYTPLDHTYIYNGIASNGGVYKF